MTMNWLQSLVIGFVSGLTELLPVSAEAHRAVLYTLFGISGDAPFRLLIHISCLLSLNGLLRNELNQLRTASRLMAIPPRRRKKPLIPADANTVRLLRSAVIALVLCRVCALSLDSIRDKLNLLPAGLIVTGLLLLIPALVRSGNMDSRNMPRINGVLMGLGAGLGGIPGFSAMGCAMSLGQWQGVGKQYALNFSCCLLLPGLGCQIAADLIALISGGFGALTMSGILQMLPGAVAAYFGCRSGYRMMRALAERNGFTVFSYYCWGFAMLCFALFLTI